MRTTRRVTKANIHNFLAVVFFSSSVCLCVCRCIMCIAHSCIHFCSIDRTEQTSFLLLFFFPTSNLKRKEDTCMNEYICMHTPSRTFVIFLDGIVAN